MPAYPRAPLPLLREYAGILVLTVARRCHGNAVTAAKLPDPALSENPLF